MKKILYIIRGIPNSGKTTLAKTLTNAVCCADDYFTYGDEYRWSRDKIGVAHKWCQRKCYRFMKVGISKIAIANTNTTAKEMKAYVDMAKEFNYQVFYLIVENRHGNKNSHNVPESTLDIMRGRFEIKL